MRYGSHSLLLMKSFNLFRFGNVEELRFPSNDLWSMENQSSGWINFFYRHDACGVPLRPCSSTLADSVDKDVELERYVPAKQQHPRHSSETNPSGNTSLFRQCALYLTAYIPEDVLASVNGCYLRDRNVWQELERIFRGMS